MGERSRRPKNPLTFRSRPRSQDLAALRSLVAATSVFYPMELAIAVELLAERLRLGRKSGYSFVFAEHGGELVGYCAWGAVPLTSASYDLYWIAVAPGWQRRGVGRELVARVEDAVALRGGGGLYIETSSREVYSRTRKFYRRAGYRQVARLEDFYAAGDHKIVFRKLLRGRA